jgi:hypothetical protein
MNTPEYYIWPEGEGMAESEHNASGFCWDMTCPCHEDTDNTQDLGDAVTDGFATATDADNVYRGKVV